MARPSFENGAGPQDTEQVDINQLHAPITREHNEPLDGFEPVAVPWILAALALAMVSGWYLGSQSGGFQSAALDGEPSASHMALSAPRQATQIDPRLVGKRIYNNCMACHQQDGRGVPGQFPPLAGSEWVQGNPRVLARILLHGMHGEVVVANQRYNSVMPAWARLSDDQIAAVLSFIRASWTNDAQPISTALITQERGLTAGRDTAWTAAELLQELP